MCGYAGKANRGRAGSAGEVDAHLSGKLTATDEAYEDSTELLKAEFTRMDDCWPLMIQDQVAAALRVQCRLFDGTMVREHATAPDKTFGLGELSAAGQKSSAAGHKSNKSFGAGGHKSRSSPRPASGFKSRTIHRWIAKGGEQAAQLAKYRITPEQLKVAAERVPIPISKLSDKPFAAEGAPPAPPGAAGGGTASALAFTKPAERAAAAAAAAAVPEPPPPPPLTEKECQAEVDAVMIDPEFVDFTIVPLLLRSGVPYLDANAFGVEIKIGSNPHAVVDEQVMGSADLFVAALTSGVPELGISPLPSGLSDKLKKTIRSDPFWKRSASDQDEQRSFTYNAAFDTPGAEGGAAGGSNPAAARLAKLKAFKNKNKTGRAAPAPTAPAPEKGGAPPPPAAEEEEEEEEEGPPPPAPAEAVL